MILSDLSIKRPVVCVVAAIFIVLVGGATRMPVVRRAVTKLFARFPSNEVHPDEAVALGAGVQAGLVGRDAALGEVIMTDVCPFTLGVETAVHVTPPSWLDSMR